MSQEPPPLAPRIAEDDSDDEDPATELDAAGDTRRRIIDGIIQPARTAGGPDSNGDDNSPSSNHWDIYRSRPQSALNISYNKPRRVISIFISRRNQLLMRPITCHMDIASE